MKIDNKMDATVAKINRLTKEGKIEWHVLSKAPSSLASTEELIDFVYTAEVSGSLFRLYKYEYRVYTDIDEWDMSQSYKLEIIDKNDNSLWEFPRGNNIKDLYDTIRFKTSKAEDFFDKFLNE
jgi:hypothetical protein